MNYYEKNYEKNDSIENGQEKWNNLSSEEKARYTDEYHQVKISVFFFVLEKILVKSN